MSALTAFCEGGAYFECPRWHDGRGWAADFYRYAVFAYDADGREEKVMGVEARRRASAGSPTETCSRSR
jgi:hypothetical protein